MDKENHNFYLVAWVPISIDIGLYLDPDIYGRNSGSVPIYR